MEPLSLLLLAFNAVLGIAAWLLKNMYTDVKEDCKTLWLQVEVIKDKYFKKEDFNEFKKEFSEFRQELRERFNRLEDDIKEKQK